MRRLTSRRVALSAAFLGLAAGGTAACDSAPETVEEEHRFYCATEGGTVVNEDNCDDDGDGRGGMFFIYHAVGYPAHIPAGQPVPAGGQRFAYNDTMARSQWGLPATGKIGNGTTTKVGVVGRGGPPVGGGG
jgi:hypothetical protein